MHGLAFGYAWRRLFNRIIPYRPNIRATVKRCTKDVYNTPQIILSHGNTGFAVHPHHMAACTDTALVTEQNDPHAVFLDVLHHPAGTVIKDNDLTIVDIAHIPDPGDAVSDL